jgi:hypothetical protein
VTVTSDVAGRVALSAPSRINIFGGDDEAAVATFGVISLVGTACSDLARNRPAVAADPGAFFPRELPAVVMVRGGSSVADRRSAATTSAGTALRRSGRERCGVILGLLKRGLNEAGSVDVIGMVVVVLSHGLTSAARRGTRVLAALSAYAGAKGIIA